jgi:hypothetical protein
VWSDTLDTVIPTCQDIESRLIKLLWRSRPTQYTSSTPASGDVSFVGSVSGHSFGSGTPQQSRLLGNAGAGDEEEPLAEKAKDAVKTSRTWYGRKFDATSDNKQKEGVDLEAFEPEKRPTALFAPIYNGLAGGLALGKV